MRWRSSDLNQYENAKQYVDTIIIPCMPFHMDANSEKLAFQNELLTIFASEIEKVLAGRVMLMPTYSYLKSAEKEAEIRRINAWITDIKKQPFTSIFLLTLDAAWKKNEQALDGHLLWLPSVQSGNLQSNEMKAVIRDQVNQIIELIRSYW
ncbi:DUF2487 family protein [Oceanobacillus sp. 143]|jgi:hypothetical protein|uniref:DUF2487 domain-containing protein n=1 Tax=Oceanobacillus zhaokaii TaxID=2052660 RepID=A0A345PH59_9BACI|nr:YpiF family protein [Oceanobacillus zhaokaii]AXI09339.1 DUF2487 domain-containing protein [Oceanobacillus zhaokaii]QGS68810.1 DUF2487 family protein [Oceanobacillus sp. 143]